MTEPDAAPPDHAPSDESPIVCDPDVLAEALLRLDREDAAAVRALSRTGCRQLARAADALAFRTARSVVGQPGREVTQDFEIADEVPASSAFGAAARQFAAAVNAALDRLDDPPFDAIVFNDRVVQRYPPTAAGISPHRDHIKYVKLIVNLAIYGRGRFYVCPDRSGAGAREIPAEPGDAILMRGPGYRGSDRRPFHAVGAVDSDRLVLGLREDGRAG